MESASKSAVTWGVAAAVMCNLPSKKKAAPAGPPAGSIDADRALGAVQLKSQRRSAFLDAGQMIHPQRLQLGLQLGRLRMGQHHR